VAQAAGLMRARLVLNLILLLLLALVAFWLWQKRQSEPPPRLSRQAVDSIQRLSIERPGAVAIELVREPSGWRLARPRQLPASEHHVQMLLRFLESPVWQRYPRDQIDLAAVGLARPGVVLQADQLRFQFGALEPLRGLRYLLQGDEVLLVQEGVSALLASPWWNFIDRRLLPAGTPLRLRFADGTVLEPGAPATWAAHWRQELASIVQPALDVETGELFELELESGERIPWRWRNGEQSQLVRIDLGLQYELSREQLDALLARP